jgi:16S rRNA (guanine966-N2)-methyltransferase
MRVIAGTYRSRLLTAPRGLDTRPTSDRLRETLFNILAPRLEGASFADLYAGSGANGIEALSRGAANVWFADSATPAVAAIRGNLASLGISSGFTIDNRSVSASLRHALEQRRSFDIVFLDPSYASAKEYDATLGLLGGECAALLAPAAVVIAEHLRKQPLAEIHGALRRTRVRQQGDSSLSIYSLNMEEPSLTGAGADGGEPGT